MAFIARHRGIGPLPSGSRLVVLVGIAVLVLPTLLSVAQQHWTTEDGAHGPILLATGLWLFWRGYSAAEVEYEEPRWTRALFIVPLLLVYTFARGYNVLFLETGALYLTLLLLACVYWPADLLRRLWFPLFYFAFLIVPPGSVVTELTQPLKLWISRAAVETLYALGYPVAQTGAAIHIAQYELLVETACAGLGSMVSLSAIGLLFVHLRRNAGVRRSVALLLAIIPIAVLTNFLRVLILVLLTYHFGNDVGQGFAHDLAGMTMFVLAVLGMFVVDAALQAGHRLRSQR